MVLGILAVAVLAIGLGLLWRPGEPQILLFIFLYSWVQAALGALYGNAIGIRLAEFVEYSGRHDFAAAMTLTGVLVLAVAMRAAAGQPIVNLQARLSELVYSRPFAYWVRLYAVAWLFSLVCQVIAPLSGGLYQPFLTISGIKWAAFVLLTFAAFSRSNRADRTIWMAIFVIEFILSLGGYFANFKDVFSFALIGLAAANVRLGRKLLIPGALLMVSMIGVGMVWTAIKGEYRVFVNAGTGQQVVLVDYGDRFVELRRLAGQIDGESLQSASENMLKRLMYHHVFGAVAAYVPYNVPHSNGAIWSEAIVRPFTPRFLFPQKRAINDSDLTNQYTGLFVATADEGTSISIGYIGEAYIDFGPVFMFAAIAVLGFFIGRVYRWLLRQPGALSAVGAALAPFALMPAHMVESSILKLFSWLILTLLACIVVIRILAPAALGQLAHPTRRAT